MSSLDLRLLQSRHYHQSLLQGGCAHSPHSLSPIRHDTAPHQLTTLVEPTFVSPSFRQNCITTHTYNTQEQYSYPKTQLPSLHQGRENNQPTDSPISYVFATKTKTKTNNDDNGDSNFNAATTTTTTTTTGTAAKTGMLLIGCGCGVHVFLFNQNASFLVTLYVGYPSLILCAILHTQKDVALAVAQPLGPGKS